MKICEAGFFSSLPDRPTDPPEYDLDYTGAIDPTDEDFEEAKE